MADIDQTFTAVGENANKQPFNATGRKKQKSYLGYLLLEYRPIR